MVSLARAELGDLGKECIKCIKIETVKGQNLILKLSSLCQVDVEI
jgi:hypothetical protein